MQSSYTILVSPRQKGNTLLKFIRNVRYEFDSITGDFVVGDDAVALFLSIKFHRLNPEYLHGRIQELKKEKWRLKVLLCLVDLENSKKDLAEITNIAALNGFTLICAWTPKECARYLETFKAYEQRSAESIKEQVEPDYQSRLTAILTSIQGVNKTDAASLGERCGTLTGIISASKKQFSACPGIGPAKIRRLFETFNEPFYPQSDPKGS